MLNVGYWERNDEKKPKQIGTLHQVLLLDLDLGQLKTYPKSKTASELKSGSRFF